MAQSVTIAGVTFPDVPSVEIAKAGGGSALFVDPSPTTAAAADVASGKTFFDASGTLTTGTASGGSSLAPIILRPDAVVEWELTEDKYAVADLGLTIPSYTTTEQVLRAESQETMTLDWTNYDYYLYQIALTTPVYSVATPSTRREIYCAQYYRDGIFAIEAGTYRAPSGETFNNPNYSTLQSSFVNRYFYYSTATAVSVTTSSNGCYQGIQAPSINNGELTIKHGRVLMKGNNSYFNSTNWGQLTDFRVQRVVRLMRAPKGSMNVDGWTEVQMLRKAITAGNTGGILA